MANHSTKWLDHPSLTVAKVRQASKLLKAEGRKLPKMGSCELNLPSGFGRTQLCRDHNGYWFSGDYRNNGGLSGARRRRRARR